MPELRLVAWLKQRRVLGAEQLLTTRVGSLHDTRHAQAATALQEWEAEGIQWKTKRDLRLQHVLSHMNHHIHPLVDKDTQERKPLPSCKAKNKPK